MKCQKCGADLADDVLFCRECGWKVEKAALFCRECGASVPAGSKFCSNCGANLSVVSDAVATPSEEDDTTVENTVPDTEPTEEPTVPIIEPSFNEAQKPQALRDKVKAKLLEFWNCLDLFCKAVTVTGGVALLLLLVAVLAHKGFGIFFSLLQIAGIVIATLWHKGVITSPKKWLKYVVLAVAILLTILNVMSYSWGHDKPTKPVAAPEYDVVPTVEETFVSDQTETTAAHIENTVPTIQKGTEYAHMVDEWNVYIATAISDSVIKVENWNKHMSNAKSVSYEYDVGTYKIADSVNAFAWIDDSHTAFSMTIEDKQKGLFGKTENLIFTININDGDVNKGSNYDQAIACYSYQNDDWNLYKAIPLTDTLVKIEAWCRGSSAGKFLYGYDAALINISDGSTDFEWTDSEHTSFTITTKDKKNTSYWKKEKFVVFELENDGYSYSNVKDFLGKWEVGEGEVAVPASASDFKYKNCNDVQVTLEEAGFTNISTEILYDIVLGWTSEGEVASVSIGGRTNYEKGEVFKLDDPVIITYHMKEADDPNKATETPTTKPSETTAPASEATEATQAPKTEKEASTTFYSTNTREVAKNGNSGVFAYKSKGGSYSIYWVIDFDNGYVYNYFEGNGDENCDRLKIDSGDLNTAVIITYHDGSDKWSYLLHFKYVNNPEHLVLIDNDGFDYHFYATDLDNALKVRDKKTIKDY